MREPVKWATTGAIDQHELISASPPGPRSILAVEAKSDELVSQRLLLADAPGLDAFGITIRHCIMAAPARPKRLHVCKLARAARLIPLHQRGRLAP